MLLNALNFGSLWDANLKSAKHHLGRVLKDAVFIIEELSQFLLKSKEFEIKIVVSILHGST